MKSEDSKIFIILGFSLRERMEIKNCSIQFKKGGVTCFF
jgi:hypothetical protein